MVEHRLRIPALRTLRAVLLAVAGAAALLAPSAQAGPGGASAGWQRDANAVCASVQVGAADALGRLVTGGDPQLGSASPEQLRLLGRYVTRVARLSLRGDERLARIEPRVPRRLRAPFAHYVALDRRDGRAALRIARVLTSGSARRGERALTKLSEHMRDDDDLHINYNAMQSGWTTHAPVPASLLRKGEPGWTELRFEYSAFVVLRQGQRS